MIFLLTLGCGSPAPTFELDLPTVDDAAKRGVAGCVMHSMKGGQGCPPDKPACSAQVLKFTGACLAKLDKAPADPTCATICEDGATEGYCSQFQGQPLCWPVIQKTLVACGCDI